MNNSLVLRVTGLKPLVFFLFFIAGGFVSSETAKVLGPPATSRPADPALFLDAAWYEAALIDAVDRWNGGLDGSQGMGAYGKYFDGLFMSDVAADWTSLKKGPQTSVSQSRAVFLQTQALYALGERADTEGGRFRVALEKGVAALIRYFYDKERGGYFWMVDPQGRVIDSDKQDYGNVHPLLALSHAAVALRDESVLCAAVDQFETICKRFIDPKYPGSIRPRLNADFSSKKPPATNNVDSTLHSFEAFLALYDAISAYQSDRSNGTAWKTSLLGGEAAFRSMIVSISGAALDDLKKNVERRIRESGDFLAFTLSKPEKDHPERLWISYNFDSNWKPAEAPYSYARQWSGARHASPGHGIELAYLLSRAVERGFPEKWLDAARAHLDFVMAHSLEKSVNAMRYDISEWDGSRLDGYTLDGLFEWWPQAETGRALMHFSVVRDSSLKDEYKKTESFIRDYMIDPKYGGWYKTVKEWRGGFQPIPGPKGSIWKTGYHAAMFYAEAIRLSRVYNNTIRQLTNKN
jgi:mannobiose 2-epimerase